MADIRINALVSTATTTAADDYLAIDGSASGTRKLSAYSPTFGGNLTVSGGTITGGTSGLSLASGGTNQNITLTPSGTGFVKNSASRGSNGTVYYTAENTSTGGSGEFQAINAAGLIGRLASYGSAFSVSGLQSKVAVSSTGGLLYFTDAANSGGTGTSRHSWMVGGFDSVPSMQLTATGNLLIGTTTDGGQKLQVAGTVYFSGDLYSNTAGSTWGADSGATGFLVYGAGGGANANKLVLRTNSTTGLTLDASQNATLAGNLTVSGNGLNTFGGTGTTNASILFGANNVANAAAGYLSISQRLNYGYALFGYNMTGTSGSDAYTSPKNATGSAGVELIGGSSGITRFIYSTAVTTGGNALTVTEAARFSSGNLLLGTTTDSGNGKLQLATHSTSAGGIGFGTDISLYRNGSGGLLATTAGTLTGGVGVGYFSITTSGASPLVLGTNGVEGARFSTTQNFEIASGKALRLGNAYTAGAPTATGYVTIQDSSGTTYKVLVGT